jgi:restriction system protein
VQVPILVVLATRWESTEVAPPARRDMPTYRDLIYPTLRAVASLGGSAQGAEIIDALTELLEVTPEQLAITYDGRPKSVLIDRMEWARSYAKLGGAAARQSREVSL